MEELEKICAIDIDGVLAEYPKSWVDWVNRTTQSEYTDLHDMKARISYDRYNALKTIYRKSGEKRSLEVMPLAKELTEGLKDRGYLIVLLTKRPFLKYPKLFADTLHWLNDSGIQYDLLFWGKDKHHQLLKYFPTVEFMIEDNHSIANDIAKHGFKCYLLENEYNVNQTYHEKVIPIKSVYEVKEWT